MPSIRPPDWQNVYTVHVHVIYPHALHAFSQGAEFTAAHPRCRGPCTSSSQCRQLSHPPASCRHLGQPLHHRYIMPDKCHLCTCSVFLVYHYIIMPYKMTLDNYIAGLLKHHIFEVQNSHLVNNNIMGMLPVFALKHSCLFLA